MIPRLFEKTATTFTNYGICPLIDADRCIVTEARNGEFTLEMDYPRDGQWAEELSVDRIILADPRDNASAQPFRIYSIEYDMNGDINVKAQHISYQLNNIIIGANWQNPGSRYPSKFWEKETQNKLSASNPFSFSTDVDDENDPVHQYGCTEATPLRTLLGGMEGSMLDLYGGEFEWDGYTVKLWKARGSNNGVKIAYTKNLTGLNYSIDLSDVYTGVVAYWSSGGTYVESDLQTTANSYSFSRDIAVDATTEFDTQPTKAQLNTWASAYVANAPTPKVSIEVEFVPLWQTEEYKDFYGLEHVSLCDTVEAIYPPLGLDVSAKVVETIYNVLADRYDEITISTVRPDIADTIFALIKETEK